MGSKGNTWDATADRKLFLGVLKTQNVSIDFEAVAKFMSTDGQVYTVSAIRNRMNKLKSMLKDKGAEDDDGTTKEKPTNRKRSAPAATNGEAPAKKGKTTKGKSGKTKDAEVEVDADGDDDEGFNGKAKQEERSDDEFV